MTTPGGVPNLPQGALTIDTLGKKLQDTSVTAVRGRAVERVSPIFDSSTGGNAAVDLTPLGILTRLFSGFNSVVANADPADVQGPEDLPDMLLQFIEDLPVIGQFVELLEAIAGTYDGHDQILLEVQQIFAPIRALVQVITGIVEGFPTPEQIISGWSGFAAALSTAVSNAAIAVGNFTSILSRFGVPDLGSWITNLLGTRTQAATADTNAATAVGITTGQQDSLDMINNVFSGGSSSQVGVTYTDLQTSGRNFFQILAQAPFNIANLDRTQTENTQTKYILSGANITPINSLIANIKSRFGI